MIDAIKGEFGRRAELAWETWKGLLEVEGILYQVPAEEVAALVRGHLEHDSADIEELFRRVLPKRSMAQLSNARGAVISAITGEIGYFLRVGADQMKKQDESNAPAATTLNIRGPVGAVVTGEYAVANVTQNVGGSAAEVAQLLSHLRTMFADLPEVSRAEVIELVDVIESESKAPAPSTSRARAALQRLNGWLETANEAKGVAANALPLVRALLSALSLNAGS